LNVLMDTHAWIEYFLGSAQGAKVKSLLDNKANVIYTAELSFAELWDWSERHDANFDQILHVVNSRSTVMPIVASTWIEGARMRHERRKHMKDFGLMDALLLAIHASLGGKMVSGDPHFKGLPGVVFL